MIPLKGSWIFIPWVQILDVCFWCYVHSRPLCAFFHLCLCFELEPEFCRITPCSLTCSFLWLEFALAIDAPKLGNEWLLVSPWPGKTLDATQNTNTERINARFLQYKEQNENSFMNLTFLPQFYTEVVTSTFLLVNTLPSPGFFFSKFTPRVENCSFEFWFCPNAWCTAQTTHSQTLSKCLCVPESPMFSHSTDYSRSQTGRPNASFNKPMA